MNQKELLDLYREFGSKAQEALDFVVKNSPIVKVGCDLSELPHDEGRIYTIGESRLISFEKREEAELVEKFPDGVYVIYDDGLVSKFDESCEKEGIKAVGIVQYGHAFTVGLKDKGTFPLVRDYEKCPKEHPFYRERLCDALMDWECIERTKHIQEVGTDIPLEDGEYIPSLPMLVAMCHYADKGLNEALKLAGGEPFDMDEYYWSSTEYSRYFARVVGFGSGYTYYNGKCVGGVIRPVSAFKLVP